jgi:signal transduction histidine kinase
MRLPPQYVVDSHRTVVPFTLSRWFATVGLLSIVLLATLGALLLSRLFEERMLLQEGRTTMQFVQGIIDAEGAARYFERPQPDHDNYMRQLLAHIARSPDVLRTNLYSRARRVIWSNDAQLTGRSFAGESNPELDAALAGHLEIHDEEVGNESEAKAEHEDLEAGADDFIELYVPVWDQGRRNVVGAVELYLSTKLLRETISSGVRLIWMGAFGAAALLYIALLPLVRHADAMIRDQQKRIVEAETLAAIGDLGSAVAHGIRNPLSVIRTSAELVKEGTGDIAREAATDIMDQVDRLEHWVRELLTYVHLPSGAQELINVEALARGILEQFGTEMSRRGIEVAAEFAADLPRVRGDTLLLGQVFRSLVANAVEAMPDGGQLSVEGTEQPQGFVCIEIRDTGLGMSEAQLARALKPFHTTKTRGLGVGLPLARRIVERMGGRIVLASNLGKGTAVEVALPVVGP